MVGEHTIHIQVDLKEITCTVYVPCNVLYVPPVIFGSGNVQLKRIETYSYKTDTLATLILFLQ